MSDSSDEGNKPDEEFGMYASCSSVSTVRLTAFEAFVLRKSGGVPPKIQSIVGQGRAGYQVTISMAYPGSAGIVSKTPRTLPMLLREKF
jgi:hypothetical protein